MDRTEDGAQGGPGSTGETGLTEFLYALKIVDVAVIESLSKEAACPYTSEQLAT